MMDPRPTTAPCREAIVGRLLLAVAALALLVAVSRNVGAPWEQGMRGVNGAAYSHVAVYHTVHYGLGATLGTPAFITETDAGLQRTINWHHPPIYWLYLALWAWPFGVSPLVLRLAHLTLFLPGLLALFCFLRRRANASAAGAGVLLFATTPLVAYYGAMVIQDGAVLAGGLLTMACFERHAANPSRRSWLGLAATFFATCSLDLSGYWWGPALFVLALGHEHRRRAIRTVFSLFPVAVAAFVTLALHYGLAMGGPLAFLRELIGVLGQEQAAAGASSLGERFWLAMQDLWLSHQNQGLLGLAVLGLGLTFLVDEPIVRRLRMAGIALLVPGLLHYVLMLHHAVDHVFWSLQGFAGLSTLAAIVPVAAAVRLRSHGPRALLVAASAMAPLVVIAWGSFHTHALIDRFAADSANDIPMVIEQALPLLEGCNTTLTSGRTTTQVQFGHTSVFYEIDTPEKLQTVLAYARATNCTGKVGFVVDPAHRDSELVALLDTLAPRREVDRSFVYQLRP